jgi:hypothetical protein
MGRRTIGHCRVLELLGLQSMKPRFAPRRKLCLTKHPKPGLNLMLGDQVPEEGQARAFVCSHGRIDDARSVPLAIQRRGAIVDEFLQLPHERIGHTLEPPRLRFLLVSLVGSKGCHLHELGRKVGLWTYIRTPNQQSRATVDLRVKRPTSSSSSSSISSSRTRSSSPS